MEQTIVAALEIMRVSTGSRRSAISGARKSCRAQAKTYEDLLAFARNGGGTVFHAVGTCRMGSDDRAVVDPSLKVRGVEGLRVADASIMPTITSANTNAASLMIGEKAASHILNG